MKGDLYNPLTPASFRNTVLVFFFFFKIINSANQITDKNCRRKQKNSKAQKVFKAEVAYLLIKISSLWLVCVQKGSHCL